MEVKRLPIEYTKQWKVVLALLVILHHLELKYQYTGIMIIWNYVGYLAVGGFFFISGYGLMVSTKEVAIKSILNRYLKVIFPYLLFSVVWGGDYFI